MKITTLWEHSHPSEMPWLVAAYDEYTEEENQGPPDSYRDAMNANPKRRELIIKVKESAILKLFETPRTAGEVK